MKLVLASVALGTLEFVLVNLHSSVLRHHILVTHFEEGRQRGHSHSIKESGGDQDVCLPHSVETQRRECLRFPG